MFIVHTLWGHTPDCHKEFDLLSPELPCTGPTPKGEWDYEPMRDLLTAKREELKGNGTVSHISIYFRDLIYGPRFGIGEYDKFQPASLVKLPVMIAFLHEADRDPKILSKKLSYTGELNTLENVEESTETIQPNTEYTIYELIEKMILYSDNYSALLLVNELNAEAKESAYFTFRDLNQLTMMLAPKADYVSIQSYSGLFAVLYNTGYLSKERSQLALDLLSKSTFHEGLVAGVPEGTIVAHKFGRKVFNDGQDSQLHDCGIVYHPSTAYILCVMTTGTDYAKEKSAIAEVSRMVYDGVTNLHLEKQ